ncbi:MAG TPA: hypothetical protein VHC44_04995 [Verrucomicrobiae bacterium]|nr:hypothetical protein [Verrucomicrobiae bacterium]
MKILDAILIFAPFVLFAAALTMWRRADAWEGMTFGRRLFLGISFSWKWWLAYSVAILFFDAALRYDRSVPGDVLVVVIAVIMAVVFSNLRPKESRRSQRNKKE